MALEATLPLSVVNVPGDYFSMAGFEVTTYGRFWVSPEGDEKTEHFNSEGEKTGESRETTGFFGDEKTEHSDTEGEKTGESRETTGFFGDEKTEHFGTGSQGSEEESEDS
jgi:hypothetical protein